MIPSTRNRSPQSWAHGIFYRLKVVKEDSIHKALFEIVTEKKGNAARSVSTVCAYLP